MGIEPTTTSLPRRCSTPEPPRQTQTKIDKAGDGNRTRMASLEGWSTTTVLLPQLKKWGRMDLNHRRASPSDLQSDALDHSATPPIRTTQKKEQLPCTEKRV